MRTKEVTITLPFKYGDGGWFRHDGWPNAELCSEAVREAFDLGRARTIDFKVTNKLPKSLTGWHILWKDKTYNNWSLITGPECQHTLMVGASNLLSENFPQNRRVYVSVYA